MSFSEEMRMIAKAVLDGDESAALGLFDMMTEVRSKLTPDKEKDCWIRFMNKCPRGIKKMVIRKGISSLPVLLSFDLLSIEEERGVGIWCMNWLRKWSVENDVRFKDQEVEDLPNMEGEKINELQRAIKILEDKFADLSYKFKGRWR